MFLFTYLKSFIHYIISKILRQRQKKNDLKNNNVKQGKFIFFPSMVVEMHSNQQTEAKISLKTILLSKSDTCFMDTS